ncbi:MAG TPA: polysaccharide deacetylase family protein [Firmicutes bacterium]|nr:polysaccharide deacetylase family protein [Bacillota bacterium]
MLIDSFLALSVIAFLAGIGNSNAFGRRLCRPEHPIDCIILDISAAVVPVLTARLAVGSGMSVVLAGLVSFVTFHLANWKPAKYKLQRYVPVLVTLGFLSPITLVLILILWQHLRRHRVSVSVSMLLMGIASIPLLWVLHRRDLYVLFALIWLMVILYNESPYLRWRNLPVAAAADLNSDSGNMKLRQRRILVRRLLSIGIVAALAAFLFFNRYVYRGFGLQPELFRVGNRELPFIALTFDDGPDPLYTPLILDILREKDVKATFFMIGRHAERHPEIVQRIVEEGHDIGNHTYSHRNLYGLDEKNTWNEIAKADEVITKIAGTKPYLFRPPRGLYTDASIEFAHELGYTTVLWSVSSRDWAEISANQLARYVINNTRGGDILLFHDSGSFIGTYGGYRYNTVNALPRIIDELEAKGFRFVTVSQLMMIAGLTESDDPLLPDILRVPPFSDGREQLEISPEP